MSDNILIGIHGDHWVRHWSRENCHIAMSKSSELGYQAITIPLKIPSRIDPVHTKQVAEEHQIKIFVNYQTTCERRRVTDQEGNTRYLHLDQDDETVYHYDEEIVQRGLDRLLTALDITEKLGSKYMGGVLYSLKWEEESSDRRSEDESVYQRHLERCEVSRQNAIRSLQTLALVAGEKDITIGMESNSSYYTRGPVEVDDVNDPNMKIHFVADQVTSDYAGGRVTSGLRSSGDKLGFILFRRKGLSPGMTHDTQAADSEFFQTVTKLGYVGVIMFMPCMPGSSLEIMSPAGKHLLELLHGDSQSQAAEGLEFLNRELIAAKSLTTMNVQMGKLGISDSS